MDRSYILNLVVGSGEQIVSHLFLHRETKTNNQIPILKCNSSYYLNTSMLICLSVGFFETLLLSTCSARKN